MAESFFMDHSLNPRKAPGDSDMDVETVSHNINTKTHASLDPVDKVAPKSPGPSRSSFTSNSSPWFRRNSFLSSAMIDSECFSFYESPSYYSPNASYNIISLNECQGFIFNQDLFASPYQQLRSKANERRYRASFSHPNGRRKSKAVPCNPATSASAIDEKKRRHTTSLDARPTYLNSMYSNDDVAIHSGDEDDEASGEFTEGREYNEDKEEKVADQEDEEGEEEDEEDDDDDYNMDYGVSGDSNRRYKVRVTDIIVSEDLDMFPSHGNC